MTFWWLFNLHSTFTCCIQYFCLLPQAPFNWPRSKVMPGSQLVPPELVPVESYPESDMALLIHACAWIYANSINIDSVTHSPIRMSVVEHLVNILSQQLLPTLRIWKNMKQHIQRAIDLACLDPMRDINILHLSSCQYLSYNDIIVPRTNVKWRSTLWKHQLLRRGWQKEQGKLKGNRYFLKINYSTIRNTSQ